MGLADNALDNLTSALRFWEVKFNEILDILLIDPQNFQGGKIWGIVSNIITLIEGIGVSLLIVLFFYGLFKSTIDFRDVFKNPKTVVFAFARIFIAEFFVVNAKEILLFTLQFVQDIIAKIEITNNAIVYTVPDNIITALDTADWWASIGAWVSSLVGGWVIRGLTLLIIVLVYGRFFKIFLLTAVSPIPLAGYASDPTEYIGNNFMKSYIGEALRGVVIITACMIFSAYATSPAASNSTTPGALVFDYVLDVVMQLLILVIMVKGSDRLVKEFFSL